MKIIIGLAGETGSGKNVFCEYVKNNYENVFYIRFSQPLTEVLGIFFEEIRKEDQQWLGTALREKYGNDIIGKAIVKRISNIKDGIIILDGVRDFTEADIIRKMGGKIVYITADPKVRWERIQTRGEKKDDAVPFEKFLEMEKAKTEIFIKGIGETADFKVTNNGTKEELDRQIKEVVNKLI
jgi:dephospho-CoA kinase